MSGGAVVGNRDGASVRTDGDFVGAVARRDGLGCAAACQVQNAHAGAALVDYQEAILSNALQWSAQEEQDQEQFCSMTHDCLVCTDED